MFIVSAAAWSGDEWARQNFAEATGPAKAFISAHQSYCRARGDHHPDLLQNITISQTHGFVERLLIDKVASIRDPRSDKRRFTTSSTRIRFGQEQYIIYHFVDGPRIDLAVGYFYNLPVLLLYHDTNTVFQIGSAFISNEFDYMRVARACLALPTPQSTGYLSPKPVVWATADLENVGHCYWQNLTCLDFLRRSGLLQYVDAVAAQQFDFFGLSRFLQATSGVVEPHTDDVLYFTLSDFYIRREVSETTRLLVPDQIWLKHQSTGPASSVAFQIRGGARRWAGQVEGIANVITELARQDPQLDYIIDGRSRCAGDNTEPDDALRHEHTIFEQIRTILPEHIRLTSTIGWEIPDKISRFSHLLAFCGPIGSGFIVLHWVLNRRGVVYGPPTMYGWPKDHGDFLNEALRQLVWFPSKFIEMAPGETLNNNSNINFDWRLLYESLSEEIRGAKADLRPFATTVGV